MDCRTWLWRLPRPLMRLSEDIIVTSPSGGHHKKQKTAQQEECFLAPSWCGCREWGPPASQNLKWPQQGRHHHTTMARFCHSGRRCQQSGVHSDRPVPANHRARYMYPRIGHKASQLTGWADALQQMHQHADVVYSIKTYMHNQP